MDNIGTKLSKIRAGTLHKFFLCNFQNNYLFINRLPVASLLQNATIIGKKKKKEVEVVVVGEVAGVEVEGKAEVEVGQMTAMMTLSLPPICLALLVQHHFLISLTPK